MCCVGVAKHGYHRQARAATSATKRGSASCLLELTVVDISVSDDKVAEYNAIAAAVQYDWDLEINNNAPATDKEILAAIQTL